MRTIKTKLLTKEMGNFLFLCAFFFQTQNTFANEPFAPIAGEIWECSTSNKTDKNLNIIVDNINLSSTGIYNGVFLSNEGQDLYSLSGAYTGQDHKHYSIVLVPNKTIYSLNGTDELIMAGKAIVHYDEYTDCFGETQGEILYNCNVSLER